MCLDWKTRSKWFHTKKRAGLYSREALLFFHCQNKFKYFAARWRTFKKKQKIVPTSAAAADRGPSADWVSKRMAWPLKSSCERFERAGFSFGTGRQDINTTTIGSSNCLCSMRTECHARSQTRELWIWFERAEIGFPRRSWRSMLSSISFIHSCPLSSSVNHLCDCCSGWHQTVFLRGAH